MNCAAVEIWKLLRDDALLLRPRASFDGFGRHDGRGWLEFHDGVSNLEAGQPAPVAAAVPGDAATDRERSDFVEPPQTADPLLEASHIHRASQNRSTPFAPAGMRMFRQGYDFLEDIGPAGPRLGLNFVSFQRDLAILMHVMHLPGWLGDVNFGGRHPDLALLSVTAAGLYAVPADAEPFPGAELFAG